MSIENEALYEKSFEEIMEHKEDKKFKEFDVRIPDLMENGVQFGHKAECSHPKMKRFIYSNTKTGSLINLDETISTLKSACEYLEQQTRKGKKILWVGVKENARAIIKSCADNSGSYYICNRWCPGILTNFQTFLRNLQSRSKMEKIVRNYEELKEQNPLEKATITKKEYQKIKKKLEKMQELYGGVLEMKKLPDIVILAENNEIVTKEASKLGIDVIKICDTNSSPEGVKFVIAGNDDSLKSLTFLLKTLFNFAVSGISARNYNQDVNELQRKAKLMDR
jgi:small subunit ribosomal protein S2